MKQNKLTHRTNEKGFTLIELMIVIAIIGILAAVAIPNFISYRDKAFCSAAETDAKSISATLADHFAIPSNTQLFTSGANTIVILNSGQQVLGPPSLEFSPLSGDNTAFIQGSIKEIEITVEEKSGRCPTDYMKAQEGWDPIQREFVKIMK